MNKELLEAMEVLEKEKNISKDTMIEAIENSLITACKNNFGKADNVKVVMNRTTGDFAVYAEKTVVEEVEDPVMEISLADARMISAKYQLGDTVQVPLDSKKFGRIATQNAKNVILQKIREEERKALYNDYYTMEKDVATGIVQRYLGKNISVNLGKLDAILNESEQVKGETFRPNERIKVYIVEVKDTTKGPRISVSRTHPDLVKRLFEEEVAEETVFVTDEDYEKDEKYIQMYMEDLKDVEELSDTGRAFLLMNIVEDNDKESLSLLSQSFLKKIVGWIEPFRRKGVLASDLIQEANLAMIAYIGEKHFLNNYEWKDKIKEGNTQDLINVLEEIEKEVKSEIEGSLRMMIDEQNMSNKAAAKVLGKVNLVNDWAKRLKEELERKPTVDELAEKMGISKENVMEAIRLSAENIEDIDIRA